MDLKHPSENEPRVGAQNKTSEESHHSVTPLAGNAEKNWWDNVKPFVEIAGIALLVVYTGFTVAIFFTNNKAAGAATEANKLTQRNLVIAQRPYIVAGRKDGIIAEFRDSQTKDGKPAVALYFQNSGHLPADLCIFVDGTASPVYCGRIMQGVKRIRTTAKDSSGFEKISDPFCPNIGGDSTYIYMVILPFNQEILDGIRNNKDSDVRISAYAQYCDPLTGYVGKQINLKYFVEYKAFGILSESDVTHLYRLVPDIRPTEYSGKLLAPCPKANEEEQYQKRFRKNAGYLD